VSVEHRGGGAPNRELTPSEAKQPENNQPALEAGEGRHGVPPPQGEPAKPQRERGERQPLPSVWNVLERKVKVDAPDIEDRPQYGSQDYKRERGEVKRLEMELWEKGTLRDKLIVALFGKMTMEPAALPILAYFRDLSLEEFQQFRSKIEPMSEAEIREEIRKAEAEFDRKAETTPGRNPPPPGSTIRV
jgi:hypothetical protein